jgi:uncharacterized protein YdiU (UPF0061 family)
VDVFTGKQLLEESDPIPMLYAGHQFDQINPLADYVIEHHYPHFPQQANPKYIAETAIRKAQDENDYSEIDKLMTLLQAPFDEHPQHEDYAGHPPHWASQLSVSCSS